MVKVIYVTKGCIATTYMHGIPCTSQWAAPSPSILSLPIGELDPHLIRGSLGPPESTSPQLKGRIDRFSRFCTAQVQML